MTGIVCAPATPLLEGRAQTAGMPPRQRVATRAAQATPGCMAVILRLGMARIAREGLVTISELLVAKSGHDRAPMAAPAALPVLETLYRLALEQGAEGFNADLFVTNRDWSGWLSDIRCPVALRHGFESRTVS